ncbi:MAG: hypothetical protein RR144_01300 [Clostridia bacterium]
MKYKKGNIQIILISFTIIIMCTILTATFLLYFQINTLIYAIKTDLFYICQNSYFSLNKEELAYADYEVNIEELNKKIVNLLNLNYSKNNVKLNKLKYDLKNKRIYIDINVEIKPIALEQILGRININIKENVKLNLMEVK